MNSGNLIPFRARAIPRQISAAMTCALCAEVETCKLIKPCEKIRALGRRASGQPLAPVYRFRRPKPETTH